MVAAAALALGAGATAAAAPDLPTSEDCLACHGDRDLKRGAPGRGKAASVFVDAEGLKASTHGALPCVGCHKTATAPHDEKLPPVDCAGCHAKARDVLAGGVHGAAKARGGAAPACASCHGTHQVRPAAAFTVDACAACHASQVELYRGSIHGVSRKRGDTDAATCRSCHGQTHAIVAKSSPESPVYHLNLPRTCAQCHGDAALAKRHNLQGGNVYQFYMDSIHGRAVTRSGLLVAANCSDCHGSHGIKAHTDPGSRVYRSNVPQTCATCHAGIEQTYRESIHSKARPGGNGPAAVCTDCHSAHQIRRVEAAPWQLDVIRECGTCHAESLRTYRDTFHGKVTQLGLTRVAKCSDCHGSHAIQPPENPASKVSAANVVATCRQCHPGATWAFAQFDPHADPEQPNHPVLHYTSVFMTALLLGTFAFFGLHTVLWFPRSLVERLRRGRGGPGREP